MTGPKVPAPLWRLPAPERRETARRLVGQRVRVTYNPGRTVKAHAHFGPPQREVLEGLLVSVAMPRFGTAADVIVVREDGYVDQALSLASVEALAPAEDASLINVLKP